MHNSNDVPLTLLRLHALRRRFDFIDVLGLDGAEESCGFHAVAVDAFVGFDRDFLGFVLGGAAGGMVPGSTLAALGYQH